MVIYYCTYLKFKQMLNIVAMFLVFVVAVIVIYIVGLFMYVVKYSSYLQILFIMVIEYGDIYKNINKSC